MPTENSITPIPAFFAIRKCPNSCVITRKLEYHNCENNAQIQNPTFLNDSKIHIHSAPSPESAPQSDSPSRYAAPSPPESIP